MVQLYLGVYYRSVWTPEIATIDPSFEKWVLPSGVLLFLNIYKDHLRQKDISVIVHISVIGLRIVRLLRPDQTG